MEDPETGSYSAAVSGDGRLLVFANRTAATIIDIDMDTVTAILSFPGYLYLQDLTIVAASGGYDLIHSAFELSDNATVEKTRQIRLLNDGTLAGQPIERTGVVSSYDTTYFSRDGRRILTVSDLVNVKVYDLDDATSPGLTLSGHTDYVQSATFSPDDKYIATTGWVRRSLSGVQIYSSVDILLGRMGQDLGCNNRRADS